MKKQEKSLGLNEAEQKFQDRLNQRVKAFKKDNSEESLEINDQDEVISQI